VIKQDNFSDWVAVAVFFFFGIVVLYCFVIFYPSRCGAIARWAKNRSKDRFRADMREQVYGIVEDEASHVELRSSTYDSSDKVKTDTLESML